MSYNIQNIQESQYILLDKINLDFKRFLYNEIDFNQRLIGIVGPRGAGKTTLILQYLKEKHHNNSGAVYFLADNVLFDKGDLFNFIRDFHLKNGGSLVCIDEIHRYKNWNQELKNIYDSFPDIKIIFSGSSSLNLIRGQYDLSRRGIIYNLPGLSFREYLLFAHNVKIKKISLKGLFKNYRQKSAEIAKNKKILKYFNDYLKEGYYPFFKETDNRRLYFQQINNVVDKTIYEDIAGFYDLKTQNLIVFKKIINFLATMDPGEININKLSNSLGKNYATVSEYLQILNEAGLIRFLPSDRAGHALVRQAEKMFLDNTNLAEAVNAILGKMVKVGSIRELFVLNQLQSTGLIPTYTKKGDLKIAGKIIEIGGRNKSEKIVQGQENVYLALDDILIADKQKIPLYLFGFLY